MKPTRLINGKVQERVAELRDSDRSEQEVRAGASGDVTYRNRRGSTGSVCYVYLGGG